MLKLSIRTGSRRLAPQMKKRSGAAGGTISIVPASRRAVLAMTSELVDRSAARGRKLRVDPDAGGGRVGLLQLVGGVDLDVEGDGFDRSPLDAQDLRLVPEPAPRVCGSSRRVIVSGLYWKTIGFPGGRRGRRSGGRLSSGGGSRGRSSWRFARTHPNGRGWRSSVSAYAWKLKLPSRTWSCRSDRHREPHKLRVGQQACEQRESRALQRDSERE